MTLKEPFPADESVNGHHIICFVRINYPGGDLEVHESVVVAKEKVRGLQRDVYSVEMDGRPVSYHTRQLRSFVRGFRYHLVRTGSRAMSKRSNGFFIKVSD